MTYMKVNVFYTVDGKDGIFVETVFAPDERSAPGAFKALQIAGAVVLFVEKSHTHV